MQSKWKFKMKNIFLLFICTKLKYLLLKSWLISWVQSKVVHTLDTYVNRCPFYLQLNGGHRICDCNVLFCWMCVHTLTGTSFCIYIFAVCLGIDNAICEIWRVGKEKLRQFISNWVGTFLKLILIQWNGCQGVSCF